MDTALPPRPPGATPLGPRLRAKAAAGFTVVEILVATFVMLFGIVSAIIVIQSSLRSLDTARNTTLAAQIIQSEMERIRLLSWSAVNSLPGSAGINIDDILPADLPSITELRNRFAVTRAATDVSGKVGELKMITVTVTWQGIDGQRHTRSSSTHYCKEGLYAYYYTKAHS